MIRPNKRKILVLFALFLLITTCFSIYTLFKKKTNFNLILISVDTLRADHLGIYGYRRNTSPNLDKFAKKSIIFNRAFANSNFTTSSHMTLFTGLLPNHHNVNDPGRYTSAQSLVNEINIDRLPLSIPVLTEYLKREKFYTAWFASSLDPWMAPTLGFHRGFDEIYPFGFSTFQSTVKICDWLIENKDRKFFAFLHTKRLHAPYVLQDKFSDFFLEKRYTGSLFTTEKKMFSRLSSYAPSLIKVSQLFPQIHDAIMSFRQSLEGFYWKSFNGSRGDIERIISSYDAAIFETDLYLKEIFLTLERANLLNKTIIILLSDHGEAFLEHGHTSHATLNKEVLHIPLIIYHPELLNEKWNLNISAKVQLADVLPTIADMLNFDLKSKVDGKSLMPLIEGHHGEIHEEIFSFLPFGSSRQYAVINDDWKFISHVGVKNELYSVRNDFAETENLINKESVRFVVQQFLKKIEKLK